MKNPEKNIKENEINLIEGLAQKLGISANAKYIYADPIEREGVTVVPVARAFYIFGGGSGEQENGHGGGGGGGVALRPCGYIEIKDGKTRFCPNRDWLSLLPLMVVTTPVILLCVRGLKRLLRRKNVEN